jgi:hypothetical protein
MAQLRHNGITGTDITCPDLMGVAGASVTCAFRMAGQPVDAVVSVESVVAERSYLSVITRARPIEESLLGQRLAADTVQLGGLATPDVDCPEDLAPFLGAPILCEVGDGERSARVNVTGVSRGKVEYKVIVS